MTGIETRGLGSDDSPGVGSVIGNSFSISAEGVSSDELELCSWSGPGEGVSPLG